MIDLLTIGDCAIDQYMQIDQKAGKSVSGDICFIHGSKVPVDKFETSIAGNSLNVAVGSKCLGIETAIFTVLGDDQNAERILRELNDLGINTSYCLKEPNSPTNIHTVIVYEADRTIFSYHHKRKYQLLNWETPKWVYYTSMGYGFEDFQKELLTYLKQTPKVGLAFNPGTIQLKTGLESFREILESTDILFINREEANILVEDKAIRVTKELCQKVTALGPKMVVITDGKNGAGAMTQTEFAEVEAYQEGRPIVDKTGAGDAFASGFLSAIMYGKSMGEALRWGAFNSGHTIREIGAIKGLLDKNSIEKLVKEYKTL